MRQRTKHSTLKNNNGHAKQRGSFMTNQRPTKERLYRWFGVQGEDPNQFMRCMMLRNEFNHNLCGITNPFLKILTSSKPQQLHARGGTNDSIESDTDGRWGRLSKPLSQVGGGNFEGNSKRLEKTVLTSRSNISLPSIRLGSNSNLEDSWWPSLQITQNNDGSDNILKKWTSFLGKNENSNGSGARNSGFREKDWRILRYRKRVGRGMDCYRKVRDAALDWEFQSADGSTGMIEVPDVDPRGESFESGILPKRSYSVQPIDDDDSDSNPYSSSSLYRSLGSRRLVSFASQSIAGFLPPFMRQRMYSINPVMVVYDLVDQRAPDGQTTFTSTAYATLKGHYLRGEERVTVALRDGSQDVEVEILSISRAGPGLLGKTLWPFIGKMQSNFFQQQLDHLSQSGLTIDAFNPTRADANKKNKESRRYLYTSMSI